MNKMMMHAAIFTSSIVSILAEGEAEQKEQGLTRETVEHLLRVVSPTCKEEMQEALSEQTEISMECKEEIQSALRDRDATSQPPPPGANANPPVLESRDNTAVWVVLIFVVILIAGLVAFCSHVYEQKKQVKKVDKSKCKNLLGCFLLFFWGFKEKNKSEPIFFYTQTLKLKITRNRNLKGS